MPVKIGCWGRLLRGGGYFKPFSASLASCATSGVVHRSTLALRSGQVLKADSTSGHVEFFRALLKAWPVSNTTIFSGFVGSFSRCREIRARAAYLSLQAGSPAKYSPRSLINNIFFVRGCAAQKFRCLIAISSGYVGLKVGKETFLFFPFFYFFLPAFGVF